MIIFFPKGGLCNRLRSLNAIINYAETHQAKLYVVWEKNNELYSEFDDLFNTNSRIHFIKSNLLQRVLRKFLHSNIFPGLVARFPNNRIYKLRKEVSLEDDQNKKFFFDNHFKKLMFIESDWDFYPKHYLHYEFLSPTPYIQKKIDQVETQFNKHTIGVHIRRTDHSVATAESSLEGFTQFMQNEINNCPEVNFFLATDTNVTNQIIKKSFPGRIHVFSKEKNRETKRGIQEAVVDLYALSKTKKIIGSYWSSFSETASQIGAVPLEIIKRES